MALRRRVPRVSTEHRPGKYLVRDEQFSGWRECVVLDLSHLGVGLQVVGEAHPELIDRSIQVEVEVGESSTTSLRLTGMVRNLSPGKRGGTRIGVEFIGLSEREQAILKTMEYLDVRW